MATYTPYLNSITVTLGGGYIHGRTYDGVLGRIFPLATVRCYSETTGALISETVSDSLGYYTLPAPPGDTYFVVADALGATAGITDNITPTI